MSRKKQLVVFAAMMARILLNMGKLIGVEIKSSNIHDKPYGKIKFLICSVPPVSYKTPYLDETIAEISRRRFR